MPLGLHEKVSRILRQPPCATPVQSGTPPRNGQNGSPTGGVLHGLSPTNLQYLLAHATTADFTPQREIAAQGEVVRSLYLILEGQVKTVRLSESGHEATIRLLQAGETFMDAVIFMGGASPITAIAMEKTSLLVIPATVVRQHVLNDPQFATNMLRIVTAHYKNAMQQIDAIVTKSPVERLGYYLLRQHLQQDCDTLEIDIPFQKATIANQLGMTPETFSRALAQIRKMGIDVDQKHIRLKDSFALCHFCDWETMQSCTRAGSPECVNFEYCHARPLPTSRRA